MKSNFVGMCIQYASGRNRRPDPPVFSDKFVLGTGIFWQFHFVILVFALGFRPDARRPEWTLPDQLSAGPPPPTQHTTPHTQHTTHIRQHTPYHTPHTPPLIHHSPNQTHPPTPNPPFSPNHLTYPFTHRSIPTITTQLYIRISLNDTNFVPSSS